LPKGEHRKFVSRLLQVRAHLILCFRAEEKIEMVRVDGKMEVRKKQTATGLDGWQPICEKNLPYELTASFLLMAAKPGYPLPIKLQSQHKDLFPLDHPINEDSGKRLAQWAAGGASAAPVQSSAASAGAPVYITAEQAFEIEASCDELGISLAKLKAAAKVDKVSQILAQDFDRAKAWIAKNKQTANAT
jgi:hypothetical protein